MEDKFKIIYRSYGIADRFPGNIIELNKHLDKYPRLKRALIMHEAKHTRKKEFNKKDLVHDLATIDQFPQIEMVKFILRHPFSLVQFLPIYPTKRHGWVYDINLVVVWIVGLIILGASLLIGFTA